MKLYLDEDSTDSVLASLLRSAGHDVQRASDAGLLGESDPVHLTHAIQAGRVLLTGNHDDFDELHDLILAARGHHPGILIVRRDNDKSRDMSPRGIVNAIGKLLSANLEFEDTIFILNQWR